MQKDIARLGLASNRCVKVSSSAGEMDNAHVRPFNIREGNAAMYYPEANVLTSREVDPLSRTPAFKSTLIRLEAQVSLCRTSE